MDVDTNWCLFCGKKTEVQYIFILFLKQYYNNQIH